MMLISLWHFSYKYDVTEYFIPSMYIYVQKQGQEKSALNDQLA